MAILFVYRGTLYYLSAVMCLYIPYHFVGWCLWNSSSHYYY